MHVQVINKPDGDDVYAGVPKDYTGKVIDSSADDKVFVAFFDHGGPGILGVPGGCGDFLYANDVNKALTDKFAANGFKELTFYVEACESGSIFKGLLQAPNAVAVTAANAKESSWGFYCPPLDKVNGKRIGSCLGDEFSIRWMCSRFRRPSGSSE